MTGHATERRTPAWPFLEDGPLVGHRVTGNWVDTIHIEGFSRGCFAWRKRISSLIVPGDGLVEHRAHGSALNVLNEALI